jgi:hypothetical protein
MPTHRVPTEKKEDRVRFKNLVRKAESLLVERGLRTADAADLLRPARELLEADLFWEHTLDGLAVFAAPGFFRHYAVPLALREIVLAEEDFHLKPLLPLLQAGARYYLLALSQKRVALLEASPEALDPILLPGLPQTVASAVALESYPPERYVGFHAQSPKAGRRRTIFHGQAEESQDAVRYLHDFCRRVDEKVSAFLRGERAPLVLAAVEYLHPIYAEANTYPNLLPEGVRQADPRVLDLGVHAQAQERPQRRVRRPWNHHRPRRQAAGRLKESLEKLRLLAGTLPPRGGRKNVAHEEDRVGPPAADGVLEKPKRRAAAPDPPRNQKAPHSGISRA